MTTLVKINGILSNGIALFTNTGIDFGFDTLSIMHDLTQGQTPIIAGGVSIEDMAGFPMELQVLRNRVLKLRPCIGYATVTAATKEVLKLQIDLDIPIEASTCSLVLLLQTADNGEPLVLNTVSMGIV